VLTFKTLVPLSGAAFSQRGFELAVAGRDGATRLYLLRIDDLIALAKSRLTRAHENRRSASGICARLG
jgi:hypothetical protein